jgi:mono/diheme cytochrome c family protein
MPELQPVARQARWLVRCLLPIGLLLAAHGAVGEEPRLDLATPLGAGEIARWSITVFPDGRNLPPGRGSVAEGAALYATQCAACHGKTGMEGPAARLAGSDGFFGFTDPLRIFRIRTNPLLVMSVGAQWPYATSIFDYVRRAMPPQAPKSLTNAEVYALTAYVLYLNDLVGEQAVMDAESLVRVEMPGAQRTVYANEPP